MIPTTASSLCLHTSCPSQSTTISDPTFAAVIFLIASITIMSFSHQSHSGCFGFALNSVPTFVEPQPTVSTFSTSSVAVEVE